MEPASIYSIYLGINYHTIYGENIYVVGSIPELGNWNIFNGFQLKYYEGGNWTNALKLKKQEQPIEYKYVVYNQWQNTAIWEDGPNRVLEMSSIKKKETFNIEVWNYREVCIRIKYDCEPREVMAICGEGPTLGNWKYPSKMDIVLKKDPLTGQRTTFWQKNFAVLPYVEKVKYRFVLMHEDEDRNIWEREPNRLCDFVALTTSSTVKKYENDTSPNKKSSIKFYKKQNKYIKYDCNFASELVIDWITENVIIGPYPQNELEIEYLSKQGVKAALNLQTNHDMKYQSTEWETLEQQYFIANIKAINLAPVKMCVADIFYKAYSYAFLLNELVEKYKIVYVHYDSGIARTPHIVAIYLIFFKGYTIEDAIALMKEKRPNVHLNKDLLSIIYNKYLKKEGTLIKNPAYFLNISNTYNRKEVKDILKVNFAAGKVNAMPNLENRLNSFGV